jgi:uncharacterized hydantoinase/oxoprolinase family protein
MSDDTIIEDNEKVVVYIRYLPLYFTKEKLEMLLSQISNVRAEELF